MFPGKTKKEEFNTYLSTEFIDKKLKIGKVSFMFKVDPADPNLFTFEAELGDDKKNESYIREGDDIISFEKTTLNILCIPYEGNTDGILYELTYKDTVKQIKKKYRYRLNEFTISDDNQANSKLFFDFTTEVIKKMVKKLKKNN